MVSEVIKALDANIGKAMDAYQRDLGKVRTGRANATMLDNVRVDYYGTLTPLNQCANISIPEPRLLVVKPWEKRLIPEIDKALREAGLGINPQSDSEVVRLPIPALTQERRKDLVKQVKAIQEEAKVAVRKCRQTAREALEGAEKAKKITEDDLKKGLDLVQKQIDVSTKKVDEIADKKQKEILEV